jgi:[ribosomal protein S18]-alanine N-acetyltransferase
VAATVEIRPFLRRHLDRVLAIEQACFARDAYPRDLFLELFAESASLFFIARSSRRIVGYCVSAASGTDAEVVSLAVLPEQRAKGIGGALLRHTIARLRRRRVCTLALTVRVDNADAIRLYRRLGFRSAGRIARYYEDRSDALLMRRRL